MRTITKRFGPRHHGRRVSDEEAYVARYKEGYKYEIIDGRLYVSPVPNLPENVLEKWLYRKLIAYEERHPKVLQFVSVKARVFVPGHELTTCPEPDLAAYFDFPANLPIGDRRWENISPILVAEVLSESDPLQDLILNVNLYLEVPSIREYWILDGSESADRPTLNVYRRRGDRWLKQRRFAYGSTYTTPLLPGFKLLIDPHR